VSPMTRHGFLCLMLFAGSLVNAQQKATTAEQQSWRAVGQNKAERKLKLQVAPVYPELARKLAVTGTVKVQLTIASNGSVKQAKLVGGHPLLVDPVMDAVKRWKYEPGPAETVQVVEVKFTPQR
jgi:TonB family protein